MSFHSKDCTKYVESRQCLYNETLESVAEYFENIFNLQVADGSLMKIRMCQIKYQAKRKLLLTLEKHYKEKICRIADQRHGDGSCHSRQSRTYLIIRTTSARAATTAIAAMTMTHARRNRRTRFLLIAATRHLSLALCMDRRVITPSKSNTTIPKNRTSVKSRIKSASMRRITTTPGTQMTTMSHALV
jgi:hypothetical protein